MLAIGFSKQYYTLWSITEEAQYSTNMRGEHYHSHIRVTFTYIQNLSKDINLAVEKAKLRGCVNLEPDLELYGRNSGFYKDIKTSCEIPDKLHFEFNFGKYFGQDIRFNRDENYLIWFYNQTENRYAKVNLEKNFGYIKDGDDLYSPSEYKKILENRGVSRKFEDFINLIKSSSSLANIIIDFDKNLNAGGYYSYNLEQYYGVPRDISIKFLDIKEMYFRGFNYSLPVIDGLAKKIKNKQMVVLAELKSSESGYYFEVIKVKRILDKI